MASKEVIKEIENYQNEVLKLNVQRLLEDIDDSFIKSRTKKHYMGLIPIDIDDYYKDDEQKSLLKYGYYRDGMEERFYNGLFVPEKNIDLIISEIKKAGYIVDNAKSNTGNENYIITLNGAKYSNFIKDHK